MLPPIPLTLAHLQFHLRCCDSGGGQLAYGNGGSGLRKVETLENKAEPLFSSGVEVTAGSGNDRLMPFRAEFKFQIKPANPSLGYRHQTCIPTPGKPAHLPAGLPYP